MIALLFVTTLLWTAGCGSSDDNGGGDPIAPPPSYFEPTDDTGDYTDDADEYDTGDTLTGYFVLQRVIIGAGVSMECYTISEDGQAEIRHSGVLSDVGWYSGDTSGGEISWRSGRTTTVIQIGDEYEFNGVLASMVGSCTP